MNKFSTLIAVVVVLFASACGQAVAPKDAVFSGSDHVVPTEDERTAELQLAAIERPQTPGTDGAVHLVKVADNHYVKDVVAPTKMFRAIQARTMCLWQVQGRADLGRFESQEEAFEAGTAAIPPEALRRPDAIISIGVEEVCEAKQEYASIK